MSGTLVIALPAMPGDPVLWGLFADGLTASGRALADVPADRADQVWAVVPGGDVLMRRVEIPARSDAQARAALPYLLEDDVAVELDGLHFAMGPAGGDGRRPVAVVSKTKMDIWTGLRPASPDALPIIGTDPRASGGFLWAAGHSSSGIMQAPATAKVLVDLVLGREPRIPLHKVSIERFLG